MKFSPFSGCAAKFFMRFALSLPLFLGTAFCYAKEISSNNSFQDTLKNFIAKADKGDADAKGLVALFSSLQLIDTKIVSEQRASTLAKESAEKQSIFGRLEVARRTKRTNPGEASKLFRELVPTLQKSAEDGDAYCQDLLGDCFAAGDGVEKNVLEAVRWYKAAALQGLPMAHADVAFLLKRGSQEVKQDWAEAARWFRMAATQGYPIAQHELGECYYAGNGVEKDLAAAARWFKQAADQGKTASLLFLSRLYQTGEGVPEDPKKAVSLVMEAATRGDAEAQVELGSRYKRGFGVEQSDTEALKWYFKALEGEGRLSDADAKAVERTISDVSPAEGNRLLQNRLQKAATQLENLAKQVAARAVDEQSGKFGGPSTEQIMIAIGGGSFGDSKVTVKRGEVLVSNGGKAPVGTKLFPVRVSGQVNGLDVSFTFRFWKDEFGDWQAEHVQK